MRPLDRGFDNGRQPVGQTMNAVSGLPAGRAKRVHPSLTAIFQMRARTKVRAFFVYILPKGRDETPRQRVRQRATASWTDHERSEWAARRASEASPSLPHRYILDESSHENAGFVFACSTPAGGMSSPDRGFDNGRQPVGQTANAVNRLPAASPSLPEPTVTPCALGPSPPP